MDMINHLEEIQDRLQKVPSYVNKGKRFRGTKLFYPADSIKLKYVKSIISKILSLGSIRNAYDFGCGTGLYVQELINQGVDTLGFDGNLGIKNELKTDENNIVFTNLEYPLPVDYVSRGLILSIEFAEHLSEKGGKLFCSTITGLSNKWIVMTASPKKGEFHLNPQPGEYWINLITRIETHLYCKDESEELMSHFKKTIPTKDGLKWFKQDLMIFRKK